MSDYKVTFHLAANEADEAAHKTYYIQINGRVYDFLILSEASAVLDAYLRGFKAAANIHGSTVEVPAFPAEYAQAHKIKRSSL